MSEDTRRIVIVEDDRTGMTPEALRRAVEDHVRFTRARSLSSATLGDVYQALALTVRDRLVHRWSATVRTYRERDVKRLYYLSAEYLLGRQLAANLLNLGLYELALHQIRAYGIELDDALQQEPDPGLGNGGLGRLAACFMDSLATLQLPGMGYGIRYEFGIFRQEIVDGWQVEQPDEWLRHGNPWEISRPEYTVEVRFGGSVEHSGGGASNPAKWTAADTVLGVPFDTPVAGYGNDTVNTLRLWQAKASEQFDLAVFNDGDYRRAVEHKALTESISKVLYPRDDSAEGKELRLRQQYFFVCCSIHDIVRRFKRDHTGWQALPDKVAIQLNDTHPAIAIAELMRVLIDLEQLPWDRAWSLTRRTFAYTNHTLLPEALEKWPLPMFERLLPRHLEIIYEINHRFLKEVHLFAPQDLDRKRRMSIIEEGSPKHVRMAYLSVVGSSRVNGVAELHSKLLRERVLTDFAEMYPERFTSKTNGVTPRRWLLQCNPHLAHLISEHIGRAWITDLSKLRQLLPLTADPAFLADLREVKRANKALLADVVRRIMGVDIDADSMFDVHVKRIHEYKRQVMKCLHAVHLYWRIKNGDDTPVPRTVLVGGKAAPGYIRAKHTIKLINDVAAMINADPATGGRLKMLFLPNYNVSMAERVIPAADLSEQISMAGKEASGTGNMKFMMNGAPTIGTLDGANIEIREEVGAEAFFLFGHDAEEVNRIKRDGYEPEAHIERSEPLRTALDLVASGFFNPDRPDLHRRLVENLRRSDPYLVCADFDSYLEAQTRAEAAFGDPQTWWPMSARNIATAGKFSSDRTIAEYADEIWGLEPVSVALDIRGHVQAAD